MLQLNSPSRAPRLVRFAHLFARRPQRTLTLPALGAALGLVIAAVGLFRFTPPPVTKVPPGYAALVNDRPILMSDLMAQVETETGVSFDQATPEQRRHVLHEMIDEELLVQRALALDLPELEVEARSALVDGVNEQSGAATLAVAPSDAELMAYYRSHIADFQNGGTMQLRDIVLRVGGFENIDQSTGQAEADAEEAVYQLRSGASLDYVMQHFGFQDSGRMKSEEQFDFAAQIHLGADLFKVAATLSDGQISEPVVQPDGVHVLVMEHRVPPRSIPFEAARNQVYEALRKEQLERVRQENLRFLRGSAQILLAPGQGE
jgi:peptidyl-prolyl cis-trans isomerase C